MDPQKLSEFLDKECRWADGELRNRSTGRRVTAVMPVHILGHPVDMGPVLEAARNFDLKVIEDATEALGANYRGQMAGHLGDLACLSFNGNKLISGSRQFVEMTPDKKIVWSKGGGVYGTARR